MDEHKALLEAYRPNDFLHQKPAEHQTYRNNVYLCTLNRQTPHITTKMKRILPLLAVIALFLTSCHTAEKVVYFQDLQSGEALPTKATEALKLQPGDRVSILVSSAASPEIAINYNLVLAQQQVGTANRSSNNQVSVYTIDENGDVNIPSLGRVHIAGLSRSEAVNKIEDLFHNGVLNDAVVTINSYDQYISVIGDVKNPGRIQISRDNITLLEALAAAGDLNITGRRDRILVMRQEGNETKSYYADIRSKDIMNSPVYNLRQNDVVYVEPNNYRANQSTSNANSFTQVSTWLSIASFLTTLVVLITN